MTWVVVGVVIVGVIATAVGVWLSRDIGRFSALRKKPLDEAPPGVVREALDMLEEYDGAEAERTCGRVVDQGGDS
jgi:hypothetical protein